MRHTTRPFAAIGVTVTLALALAMAVRPAAALEPPHDSSNNIGYGVGVKYKLGRR